jgi:hypothetical protein
MEFTEIRRLTIIGLFSGNSSGGSVDFAGQIFRNRLTYGQ